jgi:hypothetical protein
MPSPIPEPGQVVDMSFDGFSAGCYMVLEVLEKRYGWCRAKIMDMRNLNIFCDHTWHCEYPVREPTDEECALFMRTMLTL